MDRDADRTLSGPHIVRAGTDADAARERVGDDEDDTLAAAAAAVGVAAADTVLAVADTIAPAGPRSSRYSHSHHCHYRWSRSYTVEPKATSPVDNSAEKLVACAHERVAGAALDARRKPARRDAPASSAMRTPALAEAGADVEDQPVEDSAEVALGHDDSPVLHARTRADIPSPARN